MHWTFKTLLSLGIVALEARVAYKGARRTASNVSDNDDHNDLNSNAVAELIA